MRFALVIFALISAQRASAQGSGPTPAELQAMEQEFAPDETEAEVEPELVASSLGEQPLPEPEESEPYSDPDRVILGMLAAEGMSLLAFSAALVGCLFGDDDDPDDPLDDPLYDPPPSGDQARNCVFIAAGIGFGLGPIGGLAIIHNREHFPGSLGLAFTGSLLGMGGALALTLLTDVHDGVDVVYWLTLPLAGAVLMYEISGRVRRRRRTLQTTIAPRVGRHTAGLQMQLRY